MLKLSEGGKVRWRTRWDREGVKSRGGGGSRALGKGAREGGERLLKCAVGYVGCFHDVV